LLELAQAKMRDAAKQLEGVGCSHRYRAKYNLLHQSGMQMSGRDKPPESEHMLTYDMRHMDMSLMLEGEFP